MTSLRNSVRLIGRLGKQPEVRTFDSGNKMATFSLATTEKYNNAKGERVEETQWHNIVAWGKKAELAEKYLNKGEEVALEGKIITRSYDKNGEKRYITEVVVNDMLFVGSKRD
jgi:single-strand DNA-binding protein